MISNLGIRNYINTVAHGRGKNNLLISSNCSIIKHMSKLLVIFGALLIIIGIFYPYLSRIGLGKLPGDLQFKIGEGFFYFPVTTSIILSILLTLILL